MQPMPFNDRDIPRESLLERGIIGIGDRLGLLAGVVLAVSAFTGWYSGPGEGVKVSVMGWDTGVAGKVVFFLGIAVVIVIALREVGVQMPATVPESLLTIALGAPFPFGVARLEGGADAGPLTICEAPPVEIVPLC